MERARTVILCIVGFTDSGSEMRENRTKQNIKTHQSGRVSYLIVQTVSKQSNQVKKIINNGLEQVGFG